MGRPAEHVQTGLIQIKPEDPSDDIQNRPRSIPLQGGPIRDIPLLEEGLIGRSSHVVYENPEYHSVFNTLAEQDDSSQSGDSMASGTHLVSGTPFIPNFVATASGEIHEEPPTPVGIITNTATSVQNFIPTSTIHSESTIPELAGRVIINEQYPTTSSVTHLQGQGALDTNSFGQVEKPRPTHRFPNLVRAGQVAKQKIGSVYIDNFEYQQFRDESEIPELTPDGSPMPESPVIGPNLLYEPARASPLVTKPTPIEGSSKDTPIIVRRGPGRPRKHFPDPNKPKRPVGRPRKYPKVDNKGSKFQFGRTLKVDLGYKLPIGFKKRGRPRANSPSAKSTRMYEMAKYLISKRKAGQFDDVTPLLNPPSDPENIDIEDDSWITDPEDNISEPLGGVPSNHLEITPTGRPLGVAQASEMPTVIKRGRGRPRKDGTPVVGSTVWTTESGTSIVTSSGQFASSNAPTTPTEGLNEPGVISYVSSAQSGTTSDGFETPKPLEKRGRGRPRKDSTLPRSDVSKVSPSPPAKQLLIPKHKFKGEERAEMIERAQIYGARDTAIYYSQKLGKSIHENTVMATVRKYAPGVDLPKSSGKRMYTKFSPDEKKMLAQYASKYGFSQTASYFTKIWGKFISMNTVRHALLYKSRKRPKKYRKFTNLLSPPRVVPEITLKIEDEGEKENGTENVVYLE